MTQITNASRETMVGTLKARQEEVRKLDKIIMKRDYLSVENWQNDFFISNAAAYDYT